MCADPDDLPRYDGVRGVVPLVGGATVLGDAPRRRASPLLPAGPHRPVGSGRAAGAAGPAPRAPRCCAIGTSPGSRVSRHLRALLALLRPEPPRRISRRRVPASRGRPRPPPGPRAALRTDGELCAPRRRDHPRRPRRLAARRRLARSSPCRRVAELWITWWPGAKRVEGVHPRHPPDPVTRRLRMRDAERALLAAGGHSGLVRRDPARRGARGLRRPLGQRGWRAGPWSWRLDGWERRTRRCSTDSWPAWGGSRTGPPG